MDQYITLRMEGPPPESDDALRRVYGENARFSRVGAFTLVHLDDPSPEEMHRREAEFDPDEFFFDDCPLCEAAKSEGGHIVFDGSDDDPLRATSYGVDVSDPEEMKQSPAASFDLALVDLAAAAEAFGEAIDESVPVDLARRYDEAVVGLHDRFVETLWAEESARRIELFEQQLARALTVVAEVRAAAPALADRAAPLESALDRIASVWRAL